MVFLPSFLGVAALYASASLAAPTPDSYGGDEVAVSAPYGSTQTASAYGSYQSDSYDSGSYDSGSDDSDSYTTSTYGYGAGSYSASSYGYGAGSYNGGYSADSTSTATYSAWESTSTDAATSTTSCTSSWATETDAATSTDTWYTNTQTAAATSTWSSSIAYATASYGSGSSNWGSGYDSCVQQCVASYGAPPASWTPSTTQGYSGSSGTGATHTVIVAPSQGVLRYVPFVLNASVGDTVLFMWGANNHTVTKSSELQICNKTSDAPFASGEHNKSFTFSQVVNDTNPTFYYCGTPGHCEKGMFGIINPPSAYESPMSLAGQMQSMIANNTDIAAMASYSAAQTANNTVAGNWGGSIDLTNMPDWSYQYAAENVMYTRTFLAANPDVIDANGNINLGGSGSPLLIPQDITQALAVAGAAASGTASSSAAYGAAPTSSAAATPSQSAKSGAGSVASSGLAVALVAVAAAFFAL